MTYTVLAHLYNEHMYRRHLSWSPLYSYQLHNGKMYNGKLYNRTFVQQTVVQRTHLKPDSCATGHSVVDLGRGLSSPVPSYRLGSRESVRLGRFHLSRDSLSYPSTRELGRRVSCVVSLCILVCITCALTARHYNWRWATSGIVFFVLCSFELRVLNVFAVKSVLDLSRFWLTFRARASRHAINDGCAGVNCQLRLGVFFFEYIVFGWILS